MLIMKLMNVGIAMFATSFATGNKDGLLYAYATLLTMISVHSIINNIKPLEYTINEPFKYTVTEHQEYTIDSKARIYKYSVVYNTFLDLEEEYRESLYGNGILKSKIDTAIKEYLKQNEITQKRLVIKTPAWVGDINIQTNVNPNTLVIEID